MQQDADRPNPAKEAGICRANVHYLRYPPAFTTHPKTPFQKEYWRQMDHEQVSGIPYARDKEGERANSKKPVSLLVHVGLECASDLATEIMKQGTCYDEVKGQSIFVNSLLINCEVTTFTDDQCRDDPLDVIPFLDAAGGCYSTDAFESVAVTLGSRRHDYRACCK
jgi:hypothetical protein